MAMAFLAQLCALTIVANGLAMANLPCSNPSVCDPQVSTCSMSTNGQQECICMFGYSRYGDDLYNCQKSSLQCGNKVFFVDTWGDNKITQRNIGLTWYGSETVCNEVSAQLPHISDAACIDQFVRTVAQSFRHSFSVWSSFCTRPHFACASFEVTATGAGTIANTNPILKTQAYFTICTYDNACLFATCDVTRSRCVQVQNSFRCDCFSSFVQHNRTTCYAHDPCNPAWTKCNSQSSTCRRTGEYSFHCDCKQGFRQASNHTCIDNRRCLPTDEAMCDAKTSTCGPVGSSFRCYCKDGYLQLDRVKCVAIKNCFHRDLVAIPSAPSQNLNWQAASDLCQAHKMSLASSPYDGAKVPFKQTLYWQCSTQFIREQQDYSRFDLRAWSNSCKTDGACGAFVIDRDLKVYDNFLNATRDTTANSRFALCQRNLDACQAFGARCDPITSTCRTVGLSYQCACNSGYYSIQNKCLRPAPFTAPCNNRSGYQFVIGDGTGTFTRQQASEACRRMSASLSPFPPLEVDRRRVLDQCIKPHIRQYVQALSSDVNVWTTGCDRADGHCWQWNLHLNPASGQKDSYQKQRPENRTSVHYAVCNGDLDECHFGVHNCNRTMDCVNTPGSYTCVCKPGHKRSSDGATCEYNNECLNSQNKCAAAGLLCRDTVASYECHCKRGFHLGPRNTCILPEREVPACGFVQVVSGSVASNYTWPEARDQCIRQGGVLPTTTGTVAPLTICAYKQLKSFADVAKPSINVWTGTCNEDKTKCDSLTVSARHVQPNLDAYNVGVPVQSRNTTYFVACWKELDECVHKLHKCSGSTPVCRNTVGSYACEACTPGFQAVNDTCVDIDECKTKSHNCSPSETCLNAQGGFRCDCPAGKSRQGNACSDQIAKCGRGTQFILGNGSTEYDFATAQYLCQRRGANLPMRFDVANSAEVSCYIDYMQKVAGTQRATLDVWSGKCAGRCYFTTNRAEKHRNGYQAALSDVRVLTSFRLVMCERDLDECAADVHGCEMNSTTCHNTDGSFMCNCLPGLVKDTHNAKRCKYVDKCVAQTHDCDVKSTTCQNVQGSITCRCRTGYLNDTQSSKKCKDLDECAANAHGCDMGSTTCNNTHGSFTCNCLPGRVKDAQDNQTCKDFDECLTDAHGCEVNSTTCENTNGSFTCNCLPGLVKDVQNDRRCKVLSSTAANRDEDNDNDSNGTKDSFSVLGIVLAGLVACVVVLIFIAVLVSKNKRTRAVQSSTTKTGGIFGRLKSRTLRKHESVRSTYSKVLDPNGHSHPNTIIGSISDFEGTFDSTGSLNESSERRMTALSNVHHYGTTTENQSDNEQDDEIYVDVVDNSRIGAWRKSTRDTSRRPVPAAKRSQSTRMPAESMEDPGDAYGIYQGNVSDCARTNLPSVSHLVESTVAGNIGVPSITTEYDQGIYNNTALGDYSSCTSQVEKARATASSNTIFSNTAVEDYSSTETQAHATNDHKKSLKKHTSRGHAHSTRRSVDSLATNVDACAISNEANYIYTNATREMPAENRIQDAALVANNNKHAMNDAASKGYVVSAGARGDTHVASKDEDYVYTNTSVAVSAGNCIQDATLVAGNGRRALFNTASTRRVGSVRAPVAPPTTGNEEEYIYSDTAAELLAANTIKSAPLVSSNGNGGISAAEGYAVSVQAQTEASVASSEPEYIYSNAARGLCAANKIRSATLVSGNANPVVPNIAHVGSTQAPTNAAVSSSEPEYIYSDAARELCSGNKIRSATLVSGKHEDDGAKAFRSVILPSAAHSPAQDEDIYSDAAAEGFINTHSGQHCSDSDDFNVQYAFQNHTTLHSDTHDGNMMSSDVQCQYTQDSSACDIYEDTTGMYED